MGIVLWNSPHFIFSMKPGDYALKIGKGKAATTLRRF